MDTTQSILIWSWWQASSWAGYAVDHLVPQWRFPKISSAENLLKEFVTSRGTPSQVYLHRPDYKEAIGNALRLLKFYLLTGKKKSLDTSVVCRIVNGTSKFIPQFIAEPVTMFYATQVEKHCLMAKFGHIEAELYLYKLIRTPVLPYRKILDPQVLRPPFKEITRVCSEDLTKHRSTSCGNKHRILEY